MIKNGVPFCKYCEKELVALTEEECLADIEGHGWSNWKTASVHSCNTCFHKMWQPPCEICETHPCERSGCWASPPLHIFPYETYFADRLDGSEELPVIDEEWDSVKEVFWLIIRFNDTQEVSLQRDQLRGAHIFQENNEWTYIIADEDHGGRRDTARSTFDPEFSEPPQRLLDIAPVRNQAWRDTCTPYTGTR